LAGPATLLTPNPSVAGSEIDAATTAEGAALRTNCFAAGTLVLTREGLVPIETIGVGDSVWSRSEHDVGDAAWRQVLAQASTGEMEIYEVRVVAHDGRRETLRTTQTHPFWVEASGNASSGSFVIAAELVPNDTLRLADGSAAHVESVTATSVVEPVYNISVEGWRTYHVGALGVWVHNICLDQFRRMFPDVEMSEAGFADLQARMPNAKANELGGAARYEAMTNRTLYEGEPGGIDFHYTNDAGRSVSVEHMGSIGEPRDPEAFANSIYKHALKDADELVIDVTGMSPTHYVQYDAALAQAQMALAKTSRPLPPITWIGRK